MCRECVCVCEALDWCSDARRPNRGWLIPPERQMFRLYVYIMCVRMWVHASTRGDRRGLNLPPKCYKIHINVSNSTSEWKKPPTWRALILIVRFFSNNRLIIQQVEPRFVINRLRVLHYVIHAQRYESHITEAMSLCQHLGMNKWVFHYRRELVYK